VNRFQHDLERKQFDETQFDGWQEEEKHSGYDDAPVLRLPTHRTFHLTCCEVVCERFGWPALAPEHIESAGFVIRKITQNQEYAWTLEDGEPIGWLPVNNDETDPDITRRICRKGKSHKSKARTQSGEQTFPLHHTFSKDENEKTHSLLYGFVPTGGFYYHRSEQPFDETSQSEAVSYEQNAMYWPFGYKGNSSKHWVANNKFQVVNGIPSKGTFELLRKLVNRYHVGEKENELNTEILELLENVWFYHVNVIGKSDTTTNILNAPEEKRRYTRSVNLASYLKDSYKAPSAPLVTWLLQQQSDIDDNPQGIQGINELNALPTLGNLNPSRMTLVINESTTKRLRYLLDQRLKQQTLSVAKEVPLPKFTQGKHDRYQIVPFIRVKQACGGCEFVWMPAEHRTELFRIAAPFDPEASRPSLIQMPSLKDLKRGLAKGASFLTPADTFDKINNLKLGKGVNKDLLGSGPSLGIQWICSFSLPVITLVAMILLMIMVIILNLFFFWLPWVRICIPFPKMKD
jgi:hypothetical protein